MNPQQRLSALKTNTAALLGQVALATEAAKAAETERLTLERQLAQMLNTHEFTGSPAHQDVLAAISNAETKSLEESGMPVGRRHNARPDIVLAELE